MKRANVVHDLRRMAEKSPIREAMYALSSMDGPDEPRPRTHSAEWNLMKEFCGLPWRQEYPWWDNPVVWWSKP